MTFLKWILPHLPVDENCIFKPSVGMRLLFLGGGGDL